MDFEPMPERFAELADYNTTMATEQITEPAPDIHPEAQRISFGPRPVPPYSLEYHARMAALQQDYDRWAREQYTRRGYTVVELGEGAGSLAIPRALRY